MPSGPRIAVAGAGSIGCFVGGMLADAGCEVALLTRPRMIAQIATHGLRLTGFDGLDRICPAARLALSDDPSIALRDTSTVLLAVKSTDTAAMAEEIARHAPPDSVVVSLQNGVGNVARLGARLGAGRVRAAMVPFNVVAMGQGRFHRATSGDIVIARDAADTAARLTVPGLRFVASDDIEAVQWGKLLINLNNALVALSDLTLQRQLARREWRRLFADQITEALAALRAAGIRAASANPIPVWAMPHLLRSPDWLFGRAMGRGATIDPAARSSMWEDLSRRRVTEIDYLQGVIVELAQRHGLTAPLNARVRDLVKQAEASGNGPPGLKADAVALSSRN